MTAREKILAIANNELLQDRVRLLASLEREAQAAVEIRRNRQLADRLARLFESRQASTNGSA